MNKIYNEDSVTILKTLNSESIDAIITDPPYGINYQNKDWDSSDIFYKETRKWLTETFRVLKDGGSFWSFMSYENVIVFITILKEIGFNVDLKNWVIWARQKGRGSSKHLKSQREDIIFAFKGEKPKTWNELKMLRDVVTPFVKDGKPRGWFLDENGNRKRWTGLGNVWVYTAPQYNSKTDKQVHSCQKPLMMMERLIRLSTNESDVVLDPFCGSGSTLVACKMSNRQYIGIERDKKYVDISNERLREIKNFDIIEKSIATKEEIEEYMKKIEKNKNQQNHSLNEWL